LLVRVGELARAARLASRIASRSALMRLAGPVAPSIPLSGGRGADEVPNAVGDCDC
jgi:hypothetical protein